ncbi:hypothetical protein IE53DRAFT_255695 [Violaceomyces palustris]|uniref:Uncharacterized protein n=1 Tax=Violaceomyces palustris TaxID=1673888 RepID=A0ACD0NND3_9BASI|nr:hypothetical protein IE53DRAFT_255695 [Violaceomyces palustris]
MPTSSSPAQRDANVDMNPILPMGRESRMYAANSSERDGFQGGQARKAFREARHEVRYDMPSSAFEVIASSSPSSEQNRPCTNSSPSFQVRRFPNEGMDPIITEAANLTFTVGPRGEGVKGRSSAGHPAASSVQARNSTVQSRSTPGFDNRRASLVDIDISTVVSDSEEYGSIYTHEDSKLNPVVDGSGCEARPPSLPQKSRAISPPSDPISVINLPEVVFYRILKAIILEFESSPVSLQLRDWNFDTLLARRFSWAIWCGRATLISLRLVSKAWKSAEYHLD